MEDFAFDAFAAQFIKTTRDSVVRSMDDILLDETWIMPGFEEVRHDLERLSPDCKHTVGKMIPLVVDATVVAVMRVLSESSDVRLRIRGASGEFLEPVETLTDVENNVFRWIDMFAQERKNPYK